MFDISSQSNQKLRSKRRRKIGPGIQTSFTFVISFVRTWWIINEFDNILSRFAIVDSLDKLFNSDLQKQKKMCSKVFFRCKKLFGIVPHRLPYRANLHLAFEILFIYEWVQLEAFIFHVDFKVILNWCFFSSGMFYLMILVPQELFWCPTI